MATTTRRPTSSTSVGALAQQRLVERAVDAPRPARRRRARRARRWRRPRSPRGRGRASPRRRAARGGRRRSPPRRRRRARRRPRGRARSPRGPRRSPRRGARARARGSAARSGGGPAGPPRWRAGPMATPAEAATPESTSPAAGGATSAGSAAAPRRRGRRRRGRARRDPVAEALVGQRAQGVERLGGLRARCADHQRVAEARAERDDVGQARRPHRRAAALLGHADLGVEVARDGDEARRRARVQADRVADLEARLGVGRGGRVGRSAGRRGAAAPRSTPSCDAFMASAPRASAATSSSDAPAARGHRRGHRALDERRLAHQHAAAALVRASRSRTRRS